MTDDLIKSLRRGEDEGVDGWWSTMAEAADALEVQARRIAELRKEADMMHSEYKTARARIEDLEKMIAVHRLAVDIDALKARIAELEAALKPFADAWDNRYKHASHNLIRDENLRAARAALEKKND